MDVSSLTRQEDMVQRVRDLAPLVAEHRAEFDRDRQLPAQIIDALAAADLFRLWAPRAVGGAELQPRELIDIVEDASALDASVGWVITNSAVMSRMGGFLPKEVAQAWFSQADCLMASSTGGVGSARRVDGGFRISGRWPFASGVQSARRVMGLCKIEGESEDLRDSLICAYFPREGIQILDNWHVSGLRGTGSCDFTVKDLFVPAEQTHGFLAATPVESGPLYRMPILSLFPFSVALVPLGIARAAIEAFTGIAARTRGGTSLPLREREMIQTDVARAEALRRSAKALIREALDDLEAALDQGEDRLIGARAFFRVSLAHAAESCLRAVDIVAAAAGTAAISEASVLERCVRDMQAAVKHVAMGPHNFTVGGRVLLGLEPGTARF